MRKLLNRICSLWLCLGLFFLLLLWRFSAGGRLRMEKRQAFERVQGLRQSVLDRSQQGFCIHQTTIIPRLLDVNHRNWSFPRSSSINLRYRCVYYFTRLLAPLPLIQAKPVNHESHFDPANNSPRARFIASYQKAWQDWGHFVCLGCFDHHTPLAGLCHYDASHSKEPLGFLGSSAVPHMVARLSTVGLEQ